MITTKVKIILLAIIVNSVFTNYVLSSELEDEALAIFNGEIVKVETIPKALFNKWLVTVKIKSIDKNRLNINSYNGQYFIALHDLYRKFRGLAKEIVGHQYTFYLMENPDSDIYNGDFIATPIVRH